MKEVSPERRGASILLISHDVGLALGGIHWPSIPGTGQVVVVGTDEQGFGVHDVHVTWRAHDHVLQTEVSVAEPRGKGVWSIRDGQLQGLLPVSSSERSVPHQHLDLFSEPGLPIRRVLTSRNGWNRDTVERALHGTTPAKQVGMAIGRRERTPLDPVREQGATPASQHAWEIAVVE